MRDNGTANIAVYSVKNGTDYKLAMSKQSMKEGLDEVLGRVYISPSQLCLKPFIGHSSDLVAPPLD